MSKFAIEKLEDRRLLTAAVAGVSEETFVGNLTQPTAMTFAPDGRLFVAEQAGNLRVVKDGVLQPTPFLNVTVDINGERGLVGVQLDPQFATNGYVYIYWTATTPTIHNRISRYTADPSNPDVALPGSRVDLIDFATLGAGTHNGGAMHFGADGKLYVGVGDNSVGARAQALDNPFGKILRLNKDGSIPADNPFYAQATGQGRAAYAIGLRNPFTFSFEPGTGRMLIADVGGNNFEEVNIADGGGKNFGWPAVEGPSTDARFTAPAYSYAHVGNKTVSGGVITGALVYTPPAGATAALPSSFNGRFFFADGLGRYIKTLNPASPGNSVQSFATEVTNAMDADVGPDGALYVLNRNNGYNVSTVLPGRVLRYTANASGLPSIGTAPASVDVAEGGSATFTVSASGTGLSYQWQRNGTNIPGATSASYTVNDVEVSDDGDLFRVVVTNTAGSVTSAAATLSVEARAAPVPTITLPATGALYVAGQPVSFAGSATDAEDGPLAAAKLAWTVTFLTAGLERPFLPEQTGITGGSFTPETVTPYLATDAFYRVRLTATDSDGLTASTFVDIQPTVVDVTLATSTPGLTLTIDGTPVTGPTTIQAIAGLDRPLVAPSRQTVGGVVYDFVGWSDGGAAAHVVSTPTADVTYTAQYAPRVSTGTGGDLAGTVELRPTKGGAPIVAGDAGVATVRVNNVGTAKFNARVPITLYLSTDATIDDADVPVQTIQKKLSIGPNRSKAVGVKFNYPVGTSGNVYVLADVDASNLTAEADEANNTAATAAAVAVEAVERDLAGAFVNRGDLQRSVRAGRSASATIAVTTAGNSAVKGRLAIKLQLATDANGTGAIDVGTVSPKVSLKAVGEKRIKVKFRVPADLPAGSYRLIATIDPDGAFADVNPADNVVVDAAVYVIG